MYSSVSFSKLSSLDLKNNHGGEKDEHFITKGRSPRNKATSLEILANNVQDLSVENEYFSINIRTIVKLTLEKNYYVDSIPEISKGSTKKETATKKINFSQNDLLQHIGLTEDITLNIAYNIKQL